MVGCRLAKSLSFSEGKSMISKWEVINPITFTLNL